MSDLQFLSFKFSNVFLPAEAVILGFSLVIFWPKLPKMSIWFEISTSDDMQNDASDMSQFLLKYKEIVETRSKSWFFGSFWEVFLFMTSYTLWVTPQHFGKWKTLLRYISAVSFISITFVVSRIDSEAMKWSLFGGIWAFFP